MHGGYTLFSILWWPVWQWGNFCLPIADTDSCPLLYQMETVWLALALWGRYTAGITFSDTSVIASQH